MSTKFLKNYFAPVMQFLWKTIPLKNFGYTYSQGYLILSAI